MSQSTMNNFLNLLNTESFNKKEPLMLANLNFFKMIEFNHQDFSLKIMKKYNLLEQISPDDFNQPQYFSKAHEALLYFTMKQNKGKLLNYLLKYKDIDYSQINHHETLVQSAIRHQVSYKILYKLVKNTPKALLDVEKELPFLFTSSTNSLNTKNNQSFKKVIEEYIKKFKEELPDIEFQRKDEKIDILTFTHKMGNHDGLVALLDSGLFSKKQIEKAMTAPIVNPFPQEFFIPYIIKLEKKHIEDSLISVASQSKNNKKIKL